jgi:hypothetical protein
MTPEQVKASVVSKVTGKLGPIPLVDPELSQALANSEHDRPDAARGPDIWDIAPPVPAHYAQPEPAPEKAVFTAELEEALDSYKLGFSNVLVYRAFKALEARLASLEGRL